MSALRGEAEARLAERWRAIITVFGVAARRRHLAGCHTRWGPPSKAAARIKALSGKVTAAIFHLALEAIPSGPAEPRCSHMEPRSGGCCPQLLSQLELRAEGGVCCASVEENKHTTVVSCFI